MHTIPLKSTRGMHSALAAGFFSTLCVSITVMAFIALNAARGETGVVQDRVESFLSHCKAKTIQVDQHFDGVKRNITVDCEVKP